MPNHLASAPQDTGSTGAAKLIATNHPSAVEFEQSLLARGARQKACVYVSTPITTGPRALDPSAASMSQREQMAANVRHARKVVAWVASVVDEVVIDPTQFEDVDGWEQPDYHSFWLEIIDAYVGQMVFCAGWQYSTGCSIEYLHALKNALPIKDETLRLLAESEALELLTVASRELLERGLGSVAQDEARDYLLTHSRVE